MKVFEDQIAMVTGASRGIGAAIADRLGLDGATVIGTATTDSGAAAISARFREKGISGRGIALDVNDTEQLGLVVKEINAEPGAPVILVNNAGITRDQLLMRMKEEDWSEVIDTNLRSVFRLSKAFLRGMMKARFGRIINISSVVGTTGNPGQANYAASKSYDLFLAEALAEELKPQGVDVLALCPGATHTEFSTYTGLFAPLFAMQPEKVVDQALNRLGKRHTTVVGILNFLTVMSYRFVPRRMSSWLAGLVIRDMVDD